MSALSPVEIPKERDINLIFFIRNQKVILDSDLASLYEVETRVLIQAVKRNEDRFPKDFMSQLSNDEFKNLRSQSVTSSWGGRRYPPYAFTEQGVAMLSGVLNSKRAVQVNIAVIRAFVQLRQLLSSHASLSKKLSDLGHKYDAQFKVVFDAIRELMSPSIHKKKCQLDLKLMRKRNNLISG